MTLPIVTREMRRQLERDNAKFPLALTQLPRPEWHDRAPAGVFEVWRSRGHLVQIYAERNGIERLSINATAIRAAGDRWEEGIDWETLQRLKRECGRGDRWAVEIFPADAHIVNVANMRHLWLLPQAPEFAWL